MGLWRFTIEYPTVLGRQNPPTAKTLRQPYLKDLTWNNLTIVPADCTLTRHWSACISSNLSYLTILGRRTSKYPNQLGKGQKRVWYFPTGLGSYQIYIACAVFMLFAFLTTWTGKGVSQPRNKQPIIPVSPGGCLKIRTGCSKRRTWRKCEFCWLHWLLTWANSRFCSCSLRIIFFCTLCLHDPPYCWARSLGSDVLLPSVVV